MEKIILKTSELGTKEIILNEDILIKNPELKSILNRVKVNRNVGFDKDTFDKESGGGFNREFDRFV